MKNKAVCLAVLAFALVLFMGVATEAQQLPKQGSFSGHSGYVFIGKVYELEKDHILLVGEWTGTAFNDAGSGLWHLNAFVCPGVNDVKDGLANARGSCTGTDQDGDHIFVSWKCQGALPSCNGEWQHTGGTGKFIGIRGGATFTSAGIGTTSSAWNKWKGEYQLP